MTGFCRDNIALRASVILITQIVLAFFAIGCWWEGYPLDRFVRSPEERIYFVTPNGYTNELTLNVSDTDVNLVITGLFSPFASKEGDYATLVLRLTLRRGLVEEEVIILGKEVAVRFKENQMHLTSTDVADFIDRQKGETIVDLTYRSDTVRVRGMEPRMPFFDMPYISIDLSGSIRMQGTTVPFPPIAAYASKPPVGVNGNE